MSSPSTENSCAWDKLSLAHANFQRAIEDCKAAKEHELKSLQRKVNMLEHNNDTYFQEIIKLEALVAEKESELDDVRTDYKDYRDTSQQKYAELQATSEQQIAKLQRENEELTAQKDKAERKLGAYASVYHQTLTPPKALVENGSDASEEQSADERSTSDVLAASLTESPSAAVHTPKGVLDASLQKKQFENSGNEDEDVAEDEPSALKKSEEVAEDEDSEEEDTSSPPASPSKKSEEEDVIQDDSDMTAAPKNSDDENEPGAKEEDEDVEEDAKEDVEEDAKEDVEDGEEDGENVDTLLPITENQPVEAQDLKLTTPDKKFIEDKCDEDDDGFATASEDMGEVTTQDTGTQMPPRSLRKSKRRSKTSPKKTPSSTKKQKRAVRNQ